MAGKGRFHRRFGANHNCGIFVFSDGTNTRRIYSAKLAEDLLRKYTKAGTIHSRDRAETLAQIRACELPQELTDNDRKVVSEILDPRAHFAEGCVALKHVIFILENGIEDPVPIFTQEVARELVEKGIARGMIRARDRAHLLAEIEASGIAPNKEALGEEGERLIRELEKSVN